MTCLINLVENVQQVVHQRDLSISKKKNVINIFSREKSKSASARHSICRDVHFLPPTIKKKMLLFLYFYDYYPPPPNSIKQQLHNGHRSSFVLFCFPSLNGPWKINANPINKQTIRHRRLQHFGGVVFPLVVAKCPFLLYIFENVVFPLSTDTQNYFPILTKK